MSKDDGDRKLSWREIDKLKSQSGLSKIRKKLERKDKASSGIDTKNKQKYLKELDKLFVDKEELEKQSFLERLHQQYGNKNFKKLAKEFVERYGLPEDWRTLMLFLDLDDKNLVIKTLEKIKELFPQRTTTEKQGMLSKLKTLVLTSKDETISFKVETLLKELSL
ncbi:MAG: Uncharacterized protein XD42_0125 [Thermodesulfobacterium sp. 37_54]|jgi:hypothetical protein|uniref:Uncharacterized protein n=2 Tax=Thermodesulfobacterium commune TaxID=1741 RepID=A0A075WSP2_9BACT|nr:MULTISPECIES: hypothetical protein [Thermodesulfobacterium]KUJ98241.1 MAG: Uncharacterized protein XD42_0125 [Thermodesulfobacterium sp. 37_54]KUK19497.1 MAG: Uncharacterized protein XD55_0434 [Thermodesulfobacterium commune]MDK2861072.1 hypothetical protein [Thermodesulfobacterium sp.]AIH04030.1 hypothetical protein HL41_04170 [Thermodesulfobacterium commune DSM 2178]KUK37791.1 MAG: Uncharacterized protein XD67_0908 [Thermodesulfobacterium commune]